jgi:hypothetical protein
MTPHQVQCEALNVRTETKICPGLAKTEQGETYLLDARTPGPKGICCQAFAAMNSMRMAMSVTDQKDLENFEYFDVTCPHGAVTFRLSRKK